MAFKKSKRTLTPEHLAKMQEGRQKAKRHREIVADIKKLEARMQQAEHESNKPVRISGRKRRKSVVRK